MGGKFRKRMGRKRRIVDAVRGLHASNPLQETSAGTVDTEINRARRRSRRVLRIAWEVRND